MYAELRFFTIFIDQCTVVLFSIELSPKRFFYFKDNLGSVPIRCLVWFYVRKRFCFLDICTNDIRNVRRRHNNETYLTLAADNLKYRRTNKACDHSIN